MNQRSFVVAALLSFFLGPLGADRFYLGYMGLGVLKLVTFGGCGLWALIDFILILIGKMKDADGNELARYHAGAQAVRSCCRGETGSSAMNLGGTDVNSSEMPERPQTASEGQSGSRESPLSPLSGSPPRAHI